ncbi:MAG: sulfatase-like hydrolase/transferase [Roseibacillus sp.]
MKVLLTALICSLPLGAEPLLDSWLTELSGRYARIYPDNAAMNAEAPVTTWSRGQGTQANPTYAGIHEISATANSLYVSTTGLAFHIMGPWYGGNGNLFPNYPSNRAAQFRLPRTPDTSVTPKVETGLGTVGLFVDGVSMFDSRDAFSYDTSQGVDDGPGAAAAVNGDDIWNRDAYVNESDTFDPAFAHQAGNNHHYHANPPGLRHLLGDSVSYDASSNTYTESFNGTHSPILGWAQDGLPLYGPYGYSDPLDANSSVRRMVSGYQKRDGTNGSTDLTINTGVEPANFQQTGRTSLPQWAVNNGRTQINNSNQYAPPVSNNFPLGHYIEDYAYKGNLGMTLGTDFDLNEYNVRFCVTPDFPAGTWAYFSNIIGPNGEGLPEGTPVYPYNLARHFYGNPTGGNVNGGAPAAAEVLWEGGPEKELEICNIEVDDTNDNVTLTWTSVEGGNYTVSHSSDLETWDPLALAEGADATTPVTDLARAGTEDQHFYQVGLNYIQPFDDTGFDYDSSIISEGPQNSVLLLILDDWGIDSSNLYNTEAGPGIQLANMPILKSLLFSNSNATPADTPDKGLLFTRGYSQPICSPTRATTLTGRQPFQHGVGNPQANNTLPASELTFPEIISTEAPNYGLASFGKWHLGSGDTGARDTGGWPNFTGTLAGGVADYNDWTRIKIVNDILVDSGTPVTDLVGNGTYPSPYATSVQVDEAVSFINSQGSDPWVVWMGFNAPHDPFQEPPAALAPAGGYSTTGTANKDLYVKMLEALDTEIGRLLASVDLSKTNIIVVGDNGTPGQVDQAPAGGIANAKGSLNEGGIHVPFFATGPDIIQTGTTDTMVHVVDLFSTILDLTGVNVATATAGIDILSQSIVPIFQGSDMSDRCIVSEKFNLNAATDGRALMMDDWPEYKLVSIQDVTDPNDIPSYQMYLLGSDGVEANTLTTPPNPGDAWENAYNALVAKDQSLVPFVAPVEIVLYLEMPNVTGPAGVPNNVNAGVTAILVDPDPNVSGDEFNATYVARFDQTDAYSKFWVKATVTDASAINPATSVINVDYGNNPNTGDVRQFDAIQIIIVP